MADHAIDLSFVSEAIKTTLGIPVVDHIDPPVVSPFLTVNVDIDTDVSDLNSVQRGDWRARLDSDKDKLPMLIIDPGISGASRVERGSGLGAVKAPAYWFEWMLYYVMEKEDAERSSDRPIRNHYFVVFARMDAIRAKLNSDKRLGTMGFANQIAISEVGAVELSNEMNQTLSMMNSERVAAALSLSFAIVENETT